MKLIKTLPLIALGFALSTTPALALGDAAAGGNALGYGFSVSGCLEPANRQLTLRDGVNLAVGAQQRRHQKRTAEQAAGIAERAHRDVDAAALAGEGGQGCSDHHRGDVFRVQSVVRRLYAHAVEHGLKTLFSEMPSFQGVAGIV